MEREEGYYSELLVLWLGLLVMPIRLQPEKGNMEEAMAMGRTSRKVDANRLKDMEQTDRGQTRVGAQGRRGRFVEGTSLQEKSLV